MRLPKQTVFAERGTMRLRRSTPSARSPGAARSAGITPQFPCALCDIGLEVCRRAGGNPAACQLAYTVCRSQCSQPDRATGDHWRHPSPLFEPRCIVAKRSDPPRKPRPSDVDVTQLLTTGLPGNLRFMPYAKGMLAIALDANGDARSLAYVPTFLTPATLAKLTSTGKKRQRT